MRSKATREPSKSTRGKSRQNTRHVPYKSLATATRRLFRQRRWALPYSTSHPESPQMNDIPLAKFSTDSTDSKTHNTTTPRRPRSAAFKVPDISSAPTHFLHPFADTPFTNTNASKQGLVLDTILNAQTPPSPKPKRSNKLQKTESVRVYVVPTTSQKLSNPLKNPNATPPQSSSSSQSSSPSPSSTASPSSTPPPTPLEPYRGAQPPMRPPRQKKTAKNAKKMNPSAFYKIRPSEGEEQHDDDHISSSSHHHDDHANASTQHSRNNNHNSDNNNSKHYKHHNKHPTNTNNNNTNTNHHHHHHHKQHNNHNNNTNNNNNKQSWASPSLVYPPRHKQSDPRKNHRYDQEVTLLDKSTADAHDELIDAMDYYSIGIDSDHNNPHILNEQIIDDGQQVSNDTSSQQQQQRTTPEHKQLSIEDHRAMAHKISTMTQAERTKKEQELMDGLESLHKNLDNLQQQFAGPLHDIIISSYGYLQSLAMKGPDSAGGKNNRNTHDKTPIQLVENLGGIFNSLDDNTRKTIPRLGHNNNDDDDNGDFIGITAHNNKHEQITGIVESTGRAELENLLESRQTKRIPLKKVLPPSSLTQSLLSSSDDIITAGSNEVGGLTLSGASWSLPQVEGVDDPKLSMYSSEPVLSLDLLPLSVQQDLKRAEKQLLKAKEKAILQLSGEQQRLLLESDKKKKNSADSSSNNELITAKLDEQHPLVQQRVQELLVNEKAINNDTLQLMKDHLPLLRPFLPPHVDIMPPREFLEPGGLALTPDTITAITVPDNIITSQLNKLNQSNRATTLALYGQKAARAYKDITLPSESELRGKYMTIMRDTHTVIKELVKTTGYGRIIQFEHKNELLVDALNHTIDDAQLLGILKENNVLDHASYAAALITLKTGELTPLPKRYKKNNSQVPTDMQALTQPIDKFIPSLFDNQSKQSRLEKIILPYSSPDGISYVHLPLSLRRAVDQLEEVFNTMRESITPSPTAYTSMMSIYHQLGMPGRAAVLFDQMRHDSDTNPDTTTYNVMLDVLATDRKVGLCCNLFHDLRNTAVQVVHHGTHPMHDPMHSTGRKIKKLRQQIVKKARAAGIDDLDMSALSELVNQPALRKMWLGGHNDNEAPSSEVIPRPDAVTYTTVIKALGSIKDKKGALKIFDLMIHDKVTPTAFTWTAIISICCESGDFTTGLKLLHEMKREGIRPSRATYSAMLTGASSAGEISLTLALLQQMNSEDIKPDPYLLASIYRALAEAGSGHVLVRLHSQSVHGKLGPGLLPSRTSYNALLEAVADPHTWGRATLPTLALKVGLAIYQEALLHGIFPHPYTEKSGTGVVDLRPYLRGAVLFPIHFFLNLLIDPIKIYPDLIEQTLSQSDKMRPDSPDMKNKPFLDSKLVDNMDPSDPFSMSIHLQHKPTNKQPTMIFPKLKIPPKGIVVITSRDLKPIWTAAPPPTPSHRGVEYVPPAPQYVSMLTYAENVLKATRPWINYIKSPHNLHSLQIPAPTLRYWAFEQHKGLERITKQLHEATNIPHNLQLQITTKSGRIMTKMLDPSVAQQHQKHTQQQYNNHQIKYNSNSNNNVHKLLPNPNHTPSSHRPNNTHHDYGHKNDTKQKFSPNHFYKNNNSTSQNQRSNQYDDFDFSESGRPGHTM